MHPLTEARTARKMSLGRLAGASGVDRSTIFRIEEGHEPGVTKAIKLARAVGMTVEELWGAEPAEKMEVAV